MQLSPANLASFVAHPVPCLSQPIREYPEVPLAPLQEYARCWLCAARCTLQSCCRLDCCTADWCTLQKSMQKCQNLELQMWRGDTRPGIGKNVERVASRLLAAWQSWSGLRHEDAERRKSQNRQVILAPLVFNLATKIAYYYMNLVLFLSLAPNFVSGVDISLLQLWLYSFGRALSSSALSKRRNRQDDHELQMARAEACS